MIGIPARLQGPALLALLPFQHSKSSEQVFSRVPLNSRIFKIPVVGPDWNVELDGKRQNVNVVGVTASDPAFGFGDAVGVSPLLYDGHGQTGDRQKQEICRQASLSCQDGRVLYLLPQTSFRQ
jgi:hypothetical protein